MNKEQVPPPAPLERPQSASGTTAEPRLSSQPPPIPISSKPKPGAKPAYSPTPSQDSCLICRDFTAVDHHASLFPRQHVRSVAELAHQLCQPFPSHTDKARAIFIWLHHNIYYDTEAFFSGNLKPSTPLSTLQSGWAVCEGYAGLFTALATHAGVESVVVGGHGKGFGYNAHKPGQAIPPFKSGHAWNAVRIDNGEWKLVDSCWGAGHICAAGGNVYKQELNTSEFTKSNEEFGRTHFPEKSDFFFLPGGARRNWEEYVTSGGDEGPTVYSCAEPEYGIGKHTVVPTRKQIPVRTDETARFQFALACAHSVVERDVKKGPPPVFLLSTHGVSGQKDDVIPLEHVLPHGREGGGAFWYTDIPVRELGAPGQTLTLFAITSFGDRKEVRGMTVEDFRRGKGRVGMSFQGIAAWELV